MKYPFLIILTLLLSANGINAAASSMPCTSDTSCVIGVHTGEGYHYQMAQKSEPISTFFEKKEKTIGTE